MGKREHKKLSGLVAGVAAVALVLAGCAPEDEDSGDGNGNGNGAALMEGQEIIIGVFEGWDEGFVASYLMGHVFKQEGATVKYEFAAAEFVFDGVATATYDVAFDMWLPNTHADRLEEYGDQIERIGTWFDEAVLSIAVNEDSPAQTLADLPDHVDTYGGQVVGIESGSGLNQLTRESVFPTYELEAAGYEFVESSTDTMLQELDTAINAGEDIIVTLWHPHWAYPAYPIRDLEDPEDALAGGDEHIETFGRTGFSADFPEAAELIGNFHLTGDQVIEIEDIMVIQNNREDFEGSIQTWLDANPDWIDQLKAGELG